MPAGVVEPEHDDPLPARPGLARKQPQQRREERFGDTIRHVPERLARAGQDKGRDVEPFVAVMAEGCGPPALRGPDPAPDRLQPEAVLVRGPDLDRYGRMPGGFRGRDPGQFF
jgi:hypothetical protein